MLNFTFRWIGSENNFQKSENQVIYLHDLGAILTVGKLNILLKFSYSLMQEFHIIHL